MQQEEYEHIHRCVAVRLFAHPRLLNDNSLELDDLVQEGITMSMEHGVDRDLWPASAPQYAREYLRNSAGTVHYGYKPKDQLVMEYVDSNPKTEKAIESIPANQYVEEIMTQIIFNEKLIERCHASALSHVHADCTLSFYGITDDKPKSIKQLGEDYNVNPSTVFRWIQNTLDRMSEDTEMITLWEEYTL